MTDAVGPALQQGVVSTQVQQIRTPLPTVEPPVPAQAQTQTAPPPPPPPPADSGRGTQIDVSA